MMLQSTSQCICNSKLEMLKLFWRFHSLLCSKSCNLICHLRCFLLHGLTWRWANSNPGPTGQVCSKAFYCLVSQVPGQFPFPLLAQNGCFSPWKIHRIKSKTSPESTGLGRDPGASSTSPAHFRKFRLLCSFCPHLFSWKPGGPFAGVTLSVFLLGCKSPSCGSSRVWAAWA